MDIVDTVDTVDAADIVHTFDTLDNVKRINSVDNISTKKICSSSTKVVFPLVVVCCYVLCLGLAGLLAVPCLAGLCSAK